VKPDRFVLPPSSAARSTLRHTNADQRPLKCGSGAGQVGRLNETTLQDSLGLAASPLRPLQVDFRGHVRGLSQHNDAVGPDLNEATEDGELLFLTRPFDSKNTLAEERDQRGMVRQDSHLTFAAGHDDFVDVAFKRTPFRSDYLQMQGHLRCSFMRGAWTPPAIATRIVASRLARFASGDGVRHGASLHYRVAERRRPSVGPW
jgi:hypothetical protein